MSNPFESFQFADPFSAFQFKAENDSSDNVAPAASKSNNIKSKIESKALKSKINKMKEEPEVKEPIVIKKAALSLSSEIVIGSARHYRIVMNSLRSWKRTSTNSMVSTVDEYAKFLSEVSTVQSDFPFLVLCSGILACQCRDIVAMRVTKELIIKVGGDLTAQALSLITLEELEVTVKSCNFYRSKAKALSKIAVQVCALKAVPETFKGLTALSGVGPKIANLCLSVAFKQKGEIVMIKDDVMDDELVMLSPSYSNLEFPVEEENNDKDDENVDLNGDMNGENLKKSDGENDDYKRIKVESNDFVIDESISNSILEVESQFDHVKEEKIIKSEVLDSNNNTKKTKSNFFHIKSENINDNTVCENISDDNVIKKDISMSIDLCSPSSSSLANNDIDNSDSKNVESFSSSHIDINNESSLSPYKNYGSLSSSSSSSSSISSSSSNNYNPKTSNNFEGTSIRIPQNNSMLKTSINGDFGSPDTGNNGLKTSSSGGVVFGSPGSGGKFGGICVDTHVHKVSKRIGWATGSKDPEGTRKILEDLAPYEDWEELTILLINLGQTVCGPTPSCSQCPIKAYCSIGREEVNNTVKIKKVVKKRKIEKGEKVETTKEMNRRVLESNLTIDPNEIYTLSDLIGPRETIEEEKNRRIRKSNLEIDPNEIYTLSDLIGPR